MDGIQIHFVLTVQKALYVDLKEFEAVKMKATLIPSSSSSSSPATFESPPTAPDDDGALIFEAELSFSVSFHQKTSADTGLWREYYRREILEVSVVSLEDDNPTPLAVFRYNLADVVPFGWNPTVPLHVVNKHLIVPSTRESLVAKLFLVLISATHDAQKMDTSKAGTTPARFMVPRPEWKTPANQVRPPVGHEVTISPVEIAVTSMQSQVMEKLLAIEQRLTVGGGGNLAMGSTLSTPMPSNFNEAMLREKDEEIQKLKDLYEKKIATLESHDNNTNNHAPKLKTNTLEGGEGDTYSEPGSPTTLESTANGLVSSTTKCLPLPGGAQSLDALETKYRAMLKEKEDRIAELETLNKKLQEQISAAAATQPPPTAPASGKFSELSLKIQKLQREVDNLKDDNKKKTVEVEELKEQLTKSGGSGEAALPAPPPSATGGKTSELNLKIQKLQREVDTLKDDNKKKLGEIEELKEQLSKASMNSTPATPVQAPPANLSVSQLSLRNMKLQKELEETKTALEKALKAPPPPPAAAAAPTTPVSAGGSQLQQQLSEKEQRIVELEFTMADKDTKIEQLEEDVKELNEKVEELEKRLEDARTATPPPPPQLKSTPPVSPTANRVNEMNLKNQMLMREVESLKEQLASANSKTTTQPTPTNITNTESTMKIMRLQTENESLKTEIEKLQTNLAELKLSSTTSSGESDVLQEELKKTKIEVERLRSDNQDHLHMIDGLHAEIMSLSNQLLDAQNEKEDEGLKKNNNNTANLQQQLSTTTSGIGNSPVAADFCTLILLQLTTNPASVLPYLPTPFLKSHSISSYVLAHAISQWGAMKYSTPHPVVLNVATYLESAALFSSRRCTNVTQSAFWLSTTLSVATYLTKSVGVKVTKRVKGTVGGGAANECNVYRPSLNNHVGTEVEEATSSEVVVGLLQGLLDVADAVTSDLCKMERGRVDSYVHDQVLPAALALKLEGTGADCLSRLLDETYSKLSAMNVPDGISYAIMERCLSQINAAILNALLRTKDLCCLHVGQHFKQMLASVTQWMSKVKLPPEVRKALAPVKQACDVLMLPKETLLDSSVRSSVCPMITPKQLVVLVTTYHGDRLDPRPATPANVITALQQAAVNDTIPTDVRALNDNVDTWMLYPEFGKDVSPGAGGYKLKEFPLMDEKVQQTVAEVLSKALDRSLIELELLRML